MERKEIAHITIYPQKDPTTLEGRKERFSYFFDTGVKSCGEVAEKLGPLVKSKREKKPHIRDPRFLSSFFNGPRRNRDPIENDLGDVNIPTVIDTEEEV